MVNVLLSADGDIKVYSVPDIVAKNLDEICMEFSNMGGYYDEEDIPIKYRDCKWFNFQQMNIDVNWQIQILVI